jgi:hypothetical protein
MRHLRSFGLACALLLGGCGATANYIRTGDRRLPARPPSCAFWLYTAAPPAGAIEVGVVEFHEADGRGALDFEQARALAAPHVCAAGGDGLVLWSTDAKGRIPKGTIIKTPELPTPGTSSRPGADPASVPGQ